MAVPPRRWPQALVVPTSRDRHPAIASADGAIAEPDDRVRNDWRLVRATFAALTTVLAVRAVLTGPSPIDLLPVALVGLAAVATSRHRATATRLDVARRIEAESAARIAARLSRSDSSDAVVAAIVDELAAATRADHVVVVRRRPETSALDARLVSARDGIADSTTMLPAGDLDEPASRSRLGRRAASDPAQRAADRIADRLRSVYGLAETLAAPLLVDGSVAGAIVLSHRPGTRWSPSTGRILEAAALEASAALSRATARRAAEAQATTDPLTGLPNRRYLEEFTRLLSRRRRAGDAVGVLMIDVDRFKAVNDRLGHPVGDVVLRAIARVLVATVREDDVPVRYGGEEFAVILRDPTPEIALEVGERVRSAVAALDLREHGVPAVTVSVGVAVEARPTQPIGELIQRADVALYRAKRAGRDRVEAA